MMNAREHDMLPGVMWDWRTDLDFDDLLARHSELADVLIRLVDQGLVEVRRLWVDSDGNDQYEVVARDALSATLAEPAVWAYTDHTRIHRDEGLAIVETSAGRRLSRHAPPGVPEPRRSNPHLA
jgi:hypothetical protein